MRTILISAGIALPLLLSTAAGQTHFTTVYTFANANPVGLTYANGVFYGATNYASNCGTIFELQPPTAPGGAWTETTLYSFPSATAGPCGPETPVPGPGGVLYGVAYSGGEYGDGAAFELQPPASPGGAWTESVIYTLVGAPAALLPGPRGSLFTPTGNGGTYGEGSVFELTPPSSAGGTWTGTTLYSFPVGAAGGTTDSIAFGPNGVLFGANELVGPTEDSGTIFELFQPTSPGGAWTESTLYTFNGFGDGAAPNDIILGPNGTLYGATLGRAPASENGIGSVFQLTPPTTPGAPWTKTILKSFGYNYNCGPDSPLILRNGNLYGAACLSGGGVVFELQPPATTGGTWTYTALHTFTNGQVPYGPMVMTKNGALYGTTRDLSGTGPSGTAYEIVP